MKNLEVSIEDRKIIRELAKKQFEYSQLAIMEKRRIEWAKHNDLQGGRPMVHVEIGTFEHEIIEPLLRCKGEVARKIEWQLYQNILNHEYIGDDRVVPEYFGIGTGTWFKLFDLDVKRDNAKDEIGRDIGHKFNHPIEDLEEDYEKLKQSKFGVNQQEVQQYKELVEEVLGDILPVKVVGGSVGAEITQKLVHLMGMENMFFAMYDYPELFKETINRVADDYITYFKWQEKEGLLLPATNNERLGQGSFCYSNELEKIQKEDGQTIKLEHSWCYMDSQETVGVAPEMFKEFIFPAYKKIADEVGPLSYGCCEPVHPYWDECISGFDKLRKVSVSPWCDEELIGEKLRDRKNVIYQRKPSPNYIGVGKNLDEDGAREHIKRTVEAARGCKLEITQRDVYTLTGNIEKAKRYVEIIREVIDKHYQG